jgi:hypothetical protein
VLPIRFPQTQPQLGELVWMRSVAFTPIIRFHKLPHFSILANAVALNPGALCCFVQRMDLLGMGSVTLLLLWRSAWAATDLTDGIVGLCLSFCGCGLDMNVRRNVLGR